MLHCTVEGCTFTTKPRSSYQKQELGRHMKFAHGIAGKSASSIKLQAKKATANNSIIISEEKSEENGSSAKTSTAKRQYNKTIKEDDTRVLIFVGKLTALCEQEAERIGSTKRQFTERCAALFYASQIG